MIDQDALSERVAFRLTTEARRKPAQWAREEHRPLANLVFTIVHQAIRDEEQRRGRPIEVEEREQS